MEDKPTEIEATVTEEVSVEEVTETPTEGEVTEEKGADEPVVEEPVDISDPSKLYGFEIMMIRSILKGGGRMSPIKDLRLINSILKKTEKLVPEELREFPPPADQNKPETMEANQKWNERMKAFEEEFCDMPYTDMEKTTIRARISTANFVENFEMQEKILAFADKFGVK